MVALLHHHISEQHTRDMEFRTMENHPIINFTLRAFPQSLNHHPHLMFTVGENDGPGSDGEN
jgi:hypothetical protein